MLMEGTQLQNANLAKGAVNACAYSECVIDVGIHFNRNQSLWCFSTSCSPSHLNPNQQIWSISAKTSSWNQAWKIVHVGFDAASKQGKISIRCASMPSCPSFATPGMSPAMCYLQHSKMLVTMACDQCTERFALPFNNASPEPRSTSHFCDLFEPAGQTFETILWKGCAEHFHGCFQPHRILAFY